MELIQQHWIAFAVGAGLICAGAHGIQRLRVGLIARALLGAVMLTAGITLLYPLVNQDNGLKVHQISFGIAVALVGLGINQLASPVRVRLGRDA